MRKYAHEYMKSNGSWTILPSPEPGVIMFRTNSDVNQSSGLTCRMMSYASNQHQSLHLKLEPDQNYNFWAQNPDMITILEKYFDSRVVSPPFRPNAVITFLTLLQCPLEAMKDLINVLRYFFHYSNHI